jgi:hypothetical protein
MKATRNRLIQIPPKAFPFAIPALNIRIASIAIDATSTHGIFLKVEDFRIWHPIQNLPHRPESSTFGADQGPNPPSSLSSHTFKLMGSTDKTFYLPDFLPSEGEISIVKVLLKY